MSGLPDYGAALAQAHGDLWEQFLAILLLQNHTVRTVMLGTTLLGVTAGLVGTFMLLRNRSLVGDVVGHAALPGIAIAFLTMELLWPGSGRSMPVLLAGAFVSGLAGAVCVMLIDNYSRIKSDAAMAIVLSVFYGAGAALFTIVQRLPRGNSAGLQTFLNGKTASLVTGDVWLFAGIGVVVLAVTLLLHKELTLLCFDSEYAAAEGWPVLLLDTLLIGLVVTVTMIGMQSVGLILVVATLIIPPAAARFWTDEVRWMSLAAGVIGGTGSWLGTIVSSLFPRIAAGAVIVLAGAFLFVLSLALGRKRGVLIGWWRRRTTQREIGRTDLLRAIFERQEDALPGEAIPTRTQMLEHRLTFSDLLRMRHWTPATLRRLLRATEAEGLLCRSGDRSWALTERGASESRRIARNHRLWEMYLMQYADIAPSHVDRDADMIEHVLDGKIVAELERRLNDLQEIPPSSHVVGETRMENRE
jgi:manganese/zinc/iron transport system permease protein